MPFWKKPLVRLHLKDGMPSLEGVLDSYWTGWTADHYTLRLAHMLEANDSVDAARYSLDGNRVRVPRERVAFVQELTL